LLSSSHLGVTLERKRSDAAASGVGHYFFSR
jgi:hypothetical protein